MQDNPLDPQLHLPLQSLPSALQLQLMTSISFDGAAGSREMACNFTCSCSFTSHLYLVGCTSGGSDVSAAYHSSICKWALRLHVQCQVNVCCGSDFSGGGFSSYSFGIFRAWPHLMRCFLSDSIERQKEDSECYQYISLHSTVLLRTESSSSSECSQGGHLSFPMYWDTRPCRILKVCAFPVVRCSYLQVHRLLR